MWDSKVPEWVSSEESFLEEVACAIGQRRRRGIEFLKRQAKVGSVEKRREAVYFMADKGFIDDESTAVLVEAFHAEDQGLKTSALWGLINTETFALDPLELEALCRHAGDDGLSALAMVHLSNAYPERAAEILRRGLKSSNPRKREYALLLDLE